jgi:hypothetical protein
MYSNIAPEVLDQLHANNKQDDGEDIVNDTESEPDFNNEDEDL